MWDPILTITKKTSQLMLSFGFWETGDHKADLHLGAVFVLISNALNIEHGFEETAIFIWRLYAPLRPKVLTGGCCLPVRELGKKSKEASGPHIVTK